MRAREEADMVHVPLLKKATRLKNRRRKTTGLQIFYPEIYAGWAAKGEEAFKAFKGGSSVTPVTKILSSIRKRRRNMDVLVPFPFYTLP